MAEAIGVLYVGDGDADGDVSTVRESDRFDLVTGSGVDDCLARLDEGAAVDCVVSRYDLPDGDGLELLAAVRERDDRLPVFLYADTCEKAVVSEATSLGVTDYLPRTAGSDAVLVERVEAAVERHRAVREADDVDGDGEDDAGTDAVQSDHDGVVARTDRFSELAETTDEVFYMFTADWEELLFINSAYEDLWGRSVADLRADPRDFLDGIHPDDRERVLDGMERVSNGESVDVEYRVNAAEDFGRWVSARGEPIVENGDVVRVAGFVREVTDRKERERALRRERNRYVTLFENLPNPVVHGVARDGNPIVRAVNPAFEAVFGYDAETIKGKNLDEFILPPDDDGEGAALNRRILTEGTVHTEVERETADGTRTFQLDIAMQDLDADTPEGYAIYTDVTERKRREERLQRQNERLDEYASLISHDLRNPLNVLVGALELAAETGEEEQFERCRRAVDRMDRLIEDLLTLARQGDQVDDLEPVDLRLTAEDCWRTTETTDATVAVGTDRIVCADEGRLKQLFENLFRNAVEHGGADVTVTVGALDDGFYVADDGPGIPSDRREQVFESGYSTSSDGTGFGLLIVRRIAEAHGWEVSVTDSEDGGARFEVTGVEFVE